MSNELCGIEFRHLAHPTFTAGHHCDYSASTTAAVLATTCHHFCHYCTATAPTMPLPILPWSLVVFSRIGPWTIACITCIPDLMRIIERHGLLPYLFADDTQVCGLPFNQWTGRPRCPCLGVQPCTDEILDWMRSNRLERNADKTELIGCATPRRLSSTSGYSDLGRL